MNASAVYGMLILFGAAAIMTLFMMYKREKDYKLAMAKYERDMAAYNAAVAAIAAAPAYTPATPAVAAAASVSEGEVKLSGVDEKTAAMIIAILCDELGKNPAALKFHSITAL